LRNRLGGNLHILNSSIDTYASDGLGIRCALVRRLSRY
jgi:hypothetical protein